VVLHELARTRFATAQCEVELVLGWVFPAVEGMIVPGRPARASMVALPACNGRRPVMILETFEPGGNWRVSAMRPLLVPLRVSGPFWAGRRAVRRSTGCIRHDRGGLPHSSQRVGLRGGLFPVPNVWWIACCAAWAGLRGQLVDPFATGLVLGDTRHPALSGDLGVDRPT